MESEYLQGLLQENRDVGERYRMKLKLINGVDPFTLKVKELNYAIDGVPPVTNMDIVAYLVFSHSFYTADQMKAFKSLQAFKFFISGFVVKIGTKIINNFYVVVAKVKHSQKATLKPLDVWAIITENGSVCTAHCTCMAGNSEVCSHVGAILFCAEYAHSKKDVMSCTDTQALLPMPSSSQVPIVPIREMDWEKVTFSSTEKDIPSVSADELDAVLNIGMRLGHESAIMRIVEPFASHIAEGATKMLPSLFNLFSKDNINKNYSDLMQQANSLIFSINLDEKMQIEEATRKQANNKNWFLQRAGRVTASKFKAVCRTSKTKPSLTLIKSICYPTKMMFTTEALSWGIKNECNAVAAYQKCMEKENHVSLTVNEVGLLVSISWPQLAASPDRLVFCECCLGGCLEVKCPYLLHTNEIKNIDDYLKMKSSCLIKKDDKITLKKNHSYYYQKQMQIFVANVQYTDFVIWSPNFFFKTRIYPDFPFWERESKIALKFHAEIIMPELLGKFFSLKSGYAEITYWCICNGVDDGRSMIKCDDDDCETQWFHFECVGLQNIPECAWYCPECEDRQGE